MNKKNRCPQELEQSIIYLAIELARASEKYISSLDLPLICVVTYGTPARRPPVLRPTMFGDMERLSQAAPYIPLDIKEENNPPVRLYLSLSKSHELVGCSEIGEDVPLYSHKDITDALIKRRQRVITILTSGSAEAEKIRKYAKKQHGVLEVIIDDENPTKHGFSQGILIRCERDARSRGFRWGDEHRFRGEGGDASLYGNETED